MCAAAYSYLGSSGQLTPHVAFEKVNEYAQKALQLNDQVAEGHIAKAAYHLLYAWKWDEAFEALQKGIQLNPAAISAYQLLGFYYIITGKKEKAIVVMEDAVKIDPLSPIVNHYLGTMYVFNERFEDGIRCADHLIEMEPNMRAAIELKAWAIGMRGNWEQALELFKVVHRLTNHPLKGLMGVGYSYAMLGEKEKAMECVVKIEQRQRESPDVVLDGDLVGLWYALGDYDKVFYYIDQCIIKRTSPPTLFLEYPAFKALRKDPRYDQVKQKLVLK
jgi:tetratricopeptide (TPR) repeat protein